MKKRKINNGNIINKYDNIKKNYTCRKKAKFVI